MRALERQQNIVTNWMPRDAFAGNLRETGINVRSHFNICALIRWRRGLVGLTFFVARVIFLIRLVVVVLIRLIRLSILSFPVFLFNKYSGIFSVVVLIEQCSHAALFIG